MVKIPHIVQIPFLSPFKRHILRNYSYFTMFYPLRQGLEKNFFCQSQESQTPPAIFQAGGAVFSFQHSSAEASIFFFHLPRLKTMMEITMPSDQETSREVKMETG